VEVPRNYAAAQKDKFWYYWKGAMNTEIEALTRLGPYTLQPWPEKGTKVIRSMWVYALKVDNDGFVERFKARLVAMGNTQVPGVHFEETYSPVARMTTVRMLLSIAAAQGQPVEQMDFSNAYLNAEIGDSQEPIFMHQPPGYEEYDADGRLLATHESLRSPSRWYPLVP
jgi:hypothetical protein